MKNPLISIVVPIYKVEQYLDECVKSLVNQTYKNIEIILVDDGSPDRCPQLCDGWAKRDERIRVVHKPNGGLSDARNAGVAVAKGDYIGYVDSDDFVDAQMYEKLLQGFSYGDDIAVTSVKILSYKDGDITPFKNNWDITERHRVEGKNFARVMIDMSCSFTAWNKLYRRDVVDRVSFRKGRTNEDTLYMFDLGKVLKAENLALMELPYAAYYYRLRPDSICTSSKKPLTIDIVKNQEDMMAECDEMGDSLLKTTIHNVYITTLYKFCDSLLINEVWKPLYFKTYQEKLSAIPISNIIRNFKLNDVTYIIMLRSCSSLRTFLRKYIIRNA